MLLICHTASSWLCLVDQPLQPSRQLPHLSDSVLQLLILILPGHLKYLVKCPLVVFLIDKNYKFMKIQSIQLFWRMYA